MEVVSLADSTGSFFTLRNVKWTVNPVTNTDFKITGKVDLIGIPFIAPVWIIAYVTYPRRSIGPIPVEPFPPIAHAGSVAWFGSFSIDFPKGFEREGEYTLDLKMFLGPTFAQSAGPITSVVVTEPPIPPFTTLLSQKFTVTQGGAPNSFTFGAPTINGTTKPHVHAGDDITVVWPVTSNFTEAVTVSGGNLTIYDSTLLNLGSGALVGNISAPGFTIKPNETKSVTIKYKADNAFHPKDIQLALIVAGSVFTSDWITEAYYVDSRPTTLTIVTPTIQTGTALRWTWSGFTPNEAMNFVVQGTNLSVTLMSDANGAGSGSAVVNAAAGQYYLQASDQSGNTKLVGFNVTVPPSNPVVTVKNSPVQSGTAVQFSWSGFVPNQAVNFLVQGTSAYATLASDAAGKGTGSMVVIAAAGQYSLQAADQSGNSASTLFTVTGTTPPTPRLSVTNSPVLRGSAVEFNFSGFVPNQTVYVLVQGTAVQMEVTSSAQGTGSGSMVVDIPAGIYTMSAADVAADDATTTFEVQGGGGGTPTLTIYNSPIALGNQLNYGWSGFEPNQVVVIWVPGVPGASLNATSDSLGAGQRWMPINVSNGFAPGQTYTLYIMDAYGHQAQATFNTTGGGNPPSLVVTNSPVTLGLSAFFSLSHFTPNSQVDVSIETTAVSVTVSTDGQGNSSGALYLSPNQLSQGDWVLLAQDGQGLQAEAPLSIVY
jgi:hypothetical protein